MSFCTTSHTSELETRAVLTEQNDIVFRLDANDLVFIGSGIALAAVILFSQRPFKRRPSPPRVALRRPCGKSSTVAAATGNGALPPERRRAKEMSRHTASDEASWREAFERLGAHTVRSRLGTVEMSFDAPVPDIVQTEPHPPR